jgi:hypothetical protein
VLSTTLIEEHARGSLQVFFPPYIDAIGQPGEVFPGICRRRERPRLQSWRTTHCDGKEGNGFYFRYSIRPTDDTLGTGPMGRVAAENVDSISHVHFQEDSVLNEARCSGRGSLYYRASERDLCACIGVRHFRTYVFSSSFPKISVNKSFVATEARLLHDAICVHCSYCRCRSAAL